MPKKLSSVDLNEMDKHFIDAITAYKPKFGDAESLLIKNLIIAVKAAKNQLSRTNIYLMKRRIISMLKTP